MRKRNSSIYNVIDAEQEQFNSPLPLLASTAVNLWNENKGNKYGEIELYHYLKIFSIPEFEIVFFKQFEDYKNYYANGTIETFLIKEYQDLINECNDMIELINTGDWIYWTKKNNFDFYIYQKTYYNKKAYILNNDPHNYLINFKAILQFLQVDCKTPKTKPPKKETYSLKCKLATVASKIIFDDKTFKKYFDCTKESFDNFFSEDQINENTKIKINHGMFLVDIIQFLQNLHIKGVILNTKWGDSVVKTKCLIFEGEPIKKNQIINAKRGAKNDLKPELEQLLNLFLPKN